MTTPRIAVVQTAFLGDVVLTLPLVEAIKRVWPRAPVTFVCLPGTANLVDNHPCVDRLVLFDKHGRDRGQSGLRRLAGELRGEDIALLPHRSLRSAATAFLARIPIRIGFDTSPGAFLLTQALPYRKIHEVQRNLSLLAGLGVRAPAIPPRVYPTPADRRVIDALPLGPARPRVAMAPGSVWPTKRWPLVSYAILARLLRRRLGASIVLVGGLHDVPLCEQLAADFPDLLNTAGQLTPRQSAELLGRCDIAVTNDSAPAHLAAAMGTPVVAIFGPTAADFGFAPYGKRHRIVERQLACRPCGIHGGKRCPIGSFECMLSVTPDEVLRTVQSVLSASPHVESGTAEELVNRAESPSAEPISPDMG